MSAVPDLASKTWSPIRTIALVAGPILAIVLALCCQTIDGFTIQESIVVGVATLCAVWWVSIDGGKGPTKLAAESYASGSDARYNSWVLLKPAA